jgi:hypothetical protein
LVSLLVLFLVVFRSSSQITLTVASQQIAESVSTSRHSSPLAMCTGYRLFGHCAVIERQLLRHDSYACCITMPGRRFRCETLANAADSLLTEQSMFVSLYWISAPLLVSGKHFSSDGGNSVSKKCKRCYGGDWRSLGLVGVWSQVVSFVGALGRNIAPVAVEVFSHLINS